MISVCLGFLSGDFTGGVSASSVSPVAAITKLKEGLNSDIEKYFDGSVVEKLPETVGEDEEISVIVSMKTEGVVDGYLASDQTESVSEYAYGAEAKILKDKAETERKVLTRKLDKAGISYKMGETYDNVLSGFEITIKAKDFYKTEELLKQNSATAIVGEVYEESKYQVVINDVEVDKKTGIFTNTSDYTGKGVVVAILDTGLDYTHTAFEAPETADKDDLIKKENGRLYKYSEDGTKTDLFNMQGKKLSAARTTKGLTAQDVYVNRKVPYAYDYADKDPDVFPINSEHGTHVAGIIAGEDSEIKGVATEAQLAIMKVFSDSQDGAKTSWLIAALEDCVNIGVDVINMSLGSGCGFSREVDDQNVANAYNKVKEAGISLIASAANSYNSTMNSEKNGSNGLTSNPDSGTVGSPSTFAGALSVASVDGVMTPYLLYGEEIMYFKEASTADNVDKDFVNEILTARGELDGTTYDSYDFTYVTIAGNGESSYYKIHEKEYYKGKIALVRRGVTTFEEKVRTAFDQGCLGVIIYNNVSGSISMSVGNNIGAVCSLAQDEGEILASQPEGTIRISRSQEAGPFMSDFSSWGPTSDLKIKPEITGHGGEIYSSVPGQEYDKLSGTSMAAPNVSGVTALIRQYVKNEVAPKGSTPTEITAIVNRLLMSTADIIINKNGVAYAVRKQGAGLVNITKATAAEAYLVTYDRNGKEIDKTKLMDTTKLEIGDDKEKTGVYEMTFGIKALDTQNVTYDVSALVNTEGVSTTYTKHSERTVTQDGYALEGGQKSFRITSVENGSYSGNKVTVEKGETATVTVKITLSDEDKKYLDESFENGMYIEGFIKLTACDGTKVDLSVPFLGFYGDWTEAPIFDEEYYDTNKDELNSGISQEDKLMPDAYATRVIGSLYSDYISTLGTYRFTQNPSMPVIAASKEHISLSNQKAKNEKSNYSVCGIYSINAGLLRNVKIAYLTITEDSTGNVVWNKTINNQRKSYNTGGSITASPIEVKFDVSETDLKNNSKYTLRVETYIDQGENGDFAEQNNKRNVFEFPFTIDFEAPIITDVTYRTEFDDSTKKTTLYADLSVYDNHYAMALQPGVITRSKEEGYLYSLDMFGQYLTPVYSSYNSTTKVSINLTDYVQQIKSSLRIGYKDNGESYTVENANTFVVNVYDYAFNTATYELKIPDEITAMYFHEEDKPANPVDELYLNVNEFKDLARILSTYPDESWVQSLDYEVKNVTDGVEVISVVNNNIVAKESGDAVLKAIGYDKNGTRVECSLKIHVYSPDEAGYKKLTVKEVNKFDLVGYETIKAYYSLNSDDREIGITGSTTEFDKNQKTYTLSMFPSERVKINYLLESYFPERTSVTITTLDDNVVVEGDEIEARKKGNTSVTLRVRYKSPDGKEYATSYEKKISIKVKEPFTTQSIYLMSYKGMGGEVTIPANKGITTIYQYAFSNYEYVEKDLANGDVVDKEDPYYIKPVYIGENTITKVIIPKGVTSIMSYAFAGLTALKEVVFEENEKGINIGVGAFEGCTSLEKVTFAKDASGKTLIKFINKNAFANCTKLSAIDLSGVVAIGDYSFMNCNIGNLVLPKTAQSIGIGSFMGNKNMVAAEISASKIKVGVDAFYNCPMLVSISLNAPVISAQLFNGCTGLESVKLGKDVAVIGQYAFNACDKLTEITVDKKNPYLTSEDGIIYNKDKTEVVLVPRFKATATLTLPETVTKIGKGAFSGVKRIGKVIGKNVTVIDDYAFSDCTSLYSASFGNVTEIGSYAFANTGLENLPSFDKGTGEYALKTIGDYAFAYTNLETVDFREYGDGLEIGSYAFFECKNLTSFIAGNDVTIGDYAFASRIQLYTYENYQNTSYLADPRYYKEVKETVIDADGKERTFYNLYYQIEAGANSTLAEVKLGNNAQIGNYAFLFNVNLKKVELGTDAKIGDYAFSTCKNLDTINLNNVKSIGDYAFSGITTMVYTKRDSRYSYAYKYEIINGELVATDYLRSSLASGITEANLGEGVQLGTGVFAYADKLTNVTLPESFTGKVSETDDGAETFADNFVPAYAFTYAKALTSVDFTNVEGIGEYAFAFTALPSLDLSATEQIGTSAFTRTAATSVKLADGAKIGDRAFANCTNLATAENLENATEIGSEAFTRTQLSTLSLKEAEKVGDFAFAKTKITSVEFGDKLTEIGENPFYDCDIVSFGREKDVDFGNTIVTEFEENYKISDTVYVSDGVIYKNVKNGKVLVAYPKNGKATAYTVEEGTVRISANAFADSGLNSVVIASTVTAIGDKAFYGCNNLTTVTFLSLEAPVLEETYDTSYLAFTNLPFTGYTSDGNGGLYEGLGISKFYMWNVTSRYNNFYFGANFVDYVGKVKEGLVMVKPQNGKNYNSFIYGKYFTSVVNGQNAATADTVRVLGLIAGLDKEITLDDESAVVAARKAYDALPSLEQKALVTNLSILEKAESRIKILKRDNTSDTSSSSSEEEPSSNALTIILICVGGVVVLGGAAAAALILTKKKKHNKVNE